MGPDPGPRGWSLPVRRAHRRETDIVTDFLHVKWGWLCSEAGSRNFSGQCCKVFEQQHTLLPHNGRKDYQCNEGQILPDELGRFYGSDF